jgi:hypothetical protein
MGFLQNLKDLERLVLHRVIVDDLDYSRDLTSAA